VGPFERDTATEGRDVVTAAGTIPTFVTARLRLRPLRLDDAEAVEGLLLGDSAAIAMTARIPDPCTADAVRPWIAGVVGTGDTAWAVTLRSGDVFIGCVGLIVSGDPACAGVGYWIGRAFWGCGYATEALDAILQEARSRTIRIVEAEVMVGNAASSRVLTKLGFEPCGRIAKDMPARGGTRLLDRFRLELIAMVEPPD